MNSRQPYNIELAKILIWAVQHNPNLTFPEILKTYRFVQLNGIYLKDESEYLESSELLGRVRDFLDERGIKI
jgi:hypothetical protein